MTVPQAFKRQQRNRLVAAIGVICLLATAVQVFAAEGNQRQRRISFKKNAGRVDIFLNSQKITSYVYDDKKILRPYFTNLKTTDGVQVTRNHPPHKDDPDDHDTMHPGLWLAFGDISGSDFWRNKARIKHIEFIKEPAVDKGIGGFSVRNHYLAAGKVLCEEVGTFTVIPRPDGWLLLWRSQFAAKSGGFYFGDQEEMGLGVRVATPLMVKSKKGGRILDSSGRKNEKQIWSKQAAWCDYGGPLDGKYVGVTIMSHPDNFRQPRWHVRDYGLMLANPFALKAFNAGESDKTHVQPSKPFTLNFGILIHASKSDPQNSLAGAYKNYLQLQKKHQPNQPN